MGEPRRNAGDPHESGTQPMPVSAFVDACVEAPAGIALLARLEAHALGDALAFSAPRESSTASVERAVAIVETMSFGDLCADAVSAVTSLVGPWVANAPMELEAAYGRADERQPIAAAIDDRFHDELHAPMDPTAQQWWTSHARERHSTERRLFRNFDAVYGSGEFTWAGLWTVTDPPPEVHDDLIDAWELWPGPTTRWHLSVEEPTRVWEVHRPEDWRRLVLAHPTEASGSHSGWELPGPNQVVWPGLLELPGQHAAVTELSQHLVPDWSSVASSVDAVHLSWAGFITAEGFADVSEDGVVVVLRYWGSERSLWLADRFGEPEPLDAPALSGRVLDDTGASAKADEGRGDEDRGRLLRLLGRSQR